MSQQKPSSKIDNNSDVSLVYLHSAVTVHGLGIGTQTTLDGKSYEMNISSNGIILSNANVRAVVPLQNVKVYVLK